MPDIEEVKKARDIIQSLLKSRKILRIYPPNNPVYIHTLDDQCEKFKDFFYDRDELTLKIKQNEIHYDSEQVYFNPEKEDNLALFFFRDGLREITFQKGLTSEEIEEFLRIISMDFSREGVDDDVVTLFWEKDFHNLQYVVDEVILADEGGEDYEAKAMKELEEKGTDHDGLLRAYEDAFRENDVIREATIVSLTDKDLQTLLAELEKDSQNKTTKLIDILFEMVYLGESKEEYEDLVLFLMHTMEYAMAGGDLHSVIRVLNGAKGLIETENLRDEIRNYLRRFMLFAGSEKMITLLGEFIDGAQEVEEGVCDEFVRFLDKNAIVPFMKILGELKSIHARKIVIDALILLGRKDILALAKGLNDPRWYVVRNIIYILRKIGDRRAVDYLLKTVRHGDVRVKKEVIRALGELGGTGVLQALRECLDDPDMQVRSASLKALGTVGSEAAKRIIMNSITDKDFRDRDFEEKKEYFEVLSHWHDKDIFVFLVDTLKKKTFFGRSRNYENRACAAYGLGLLGNRDALPLLNKLRSDNNKLMREFIYTAIKRLEYGQ